MALLQCPNLAFPSVLLFLMGFALGDDFCKGVLETILSSAAADTKKLKDDPSIFPEQQEVFPIADDNLKQMLIAKNSPTRLDEDGYPKANEEWPVRFMFGIPPEEEPNYRQIILGVNNYGRTKMGKLTISCRLEGDCAKAVAEFEQLKVEKKLKTCEVEGNLDDYVLSTGTKGDGIDLAPLPDKTVAGIVTKLFQSHNPKDEPWVAKIAKIDEKEGTLRLNRDLVEGEEVEPNGIEFVVLNLLQMDKVAREFLASAFAVKRQTARLNLGSVPTAATAIVQRRPPTLRQRLRKFFTRRT